MIRAELASGYARCAFPYLFDHIEVCGSRFTGPRPGNYALADFDRPAQPVSLCLLGAFYCEFPSGPNLAALANYAAEVLECNGFYGLKGARRVTATAGSTA